MSLIRVQSPKSGTSMHPKMHPGILLPLLTRQVWTNLKNFPVVCPLRVHIAPNKNCTSTWSPSESRPYLSPSGHRASRFHSRFRHVPTDPCLKTSPETVGSHPAHSRAARQWQAENRFSCPPVRAVWYTSTSSSQRSACLQTAEWQILPSDHRASRLWLAFWSGPPDSYPGRDACPSAKESNSPFP
jgi:hypothetical protein